MAFPYLSENGFETGGLGHLDSETDTENRIEVVHYTQLANLPGHPAPYRGAYCLMVHLENDGSPAAAFFTETDTWDLSADGTIWFRMMIYVTPDTVMADNDEFNFLILFSGANTVEAVAAINYTTASGFRIGIGELAASSFLPFTLGVWHCFEWSANIDSGANDGTIDAFLDGAAFTQVTGLTQAVITSGAIGSRSQDAGTTRGTMLFDDVIADSARVGKIANRWPHQLVMTASGHAFVGPGIVEDVSLMSGAGTDCVVTLYDTDTGVTSDENNIVAELKNTANNQLVNPDDKTLHFKRGCYVSMSGTTPRALVKIKKAQAYFSDGAIRTFAQKRAAHPLGL